MRASWKPVLTAALVAALLTGALPASTQAKPKRKPKTFTAEGTVYGAGVVTHSSFIAQCPEVPTTQGVDAYVVEIPMELAAKPSEATVEATSLVTDPSVELSFYTYGCEQGELYVGAPTTVPAGTGYIVVQDLNGAAFDFKLLLTQG